MYTDIIFPGGQTQGDFADLVANGGLSHSGQERFDPGLLRPYVNPIDDKHYCSVARGYDEPVTNADGTPVTNADGTPRMAPAYEEVLVRDLIDAGINSPVFNATSLSKDHWLKLDSRVVMAARQRLRAWSDLMAASSFGSFDGMSASLLEHETLTDDGTAVVDMDGLATSNSDESHYQLEAVPLPITHSDFWYSKRQFVTSKSQGKPLSLTRAEQAARRVAETVEQTLIGTVTGMTFGTAANYGRTPTVYGLTNFPNRATKTNLTASASATGKNIVDEVIAMRELAFGQNFYGPFMLYVSTGYDAILDEDYKATEASSTQTTRQRLREIEGITDVRRLDYLTGDVMILVQMTSEVIEAINGLDITTVQWESKGGLRLDFKVMAIHVPSIKADASGNCGIVHGTTS